jgi:HNH endonuclease
MRKKNLIGRVFGRLTVVSEANRIGGKTAWHCICKCGKQKIAKSHNLLYGHTKSCGCLQKESVCRGSSHGQFKTGRSKDKKGYILLSGYQGHPRSYSSGQVLEHVIIMEKKLGRALLMSERVHHKNGIRHDNRPSNLELWCCNHPAGQRVSDMLSFCRNFLKLYGYSATKKRK